MNKYLQVFKISFQQEFAYRLNFIMWRVRNMTYLFLVYFLWDSVFSDPGRVIFGYDRAKILTYIFGIFIIRTIVTASRTIDIGGEISRGELANYLLKPVNYFKYWFTRDLSSKALNLGFLAFEVAILFLIFKPTIFLQTNPFFLILFLISLVLAVILYFLILFITNIFTLWYPDQAWGANFLLIIFIEYLGGGMFPLNILPETLQKILYATPFPYLLFAPLQIYLGAFNVAASLRTVFIEVFFVFLFAIILKSLWNKGLRTYSSEGR